LTPSVPEWDSTLAAQLACRPFIHIPGPNPILTPGPTGAWDDRIIEAADVVKDHDTYYLYYHGASAKASYQLGVATASHPLGPWTKHPDNPVLGSGQPGEWDHHYVGCAFILRDRTDKYYMWYSGRSPDDTATPLPHHHVGLATAPHPLGPWTKHPANPIIRNFGYVGGVVKVGDRFHMYNEHPIGASGPDYGPISVATSPAPEGPWQVEADPVLRPGEMGEWDDGGFSEAKVTHQDGVYHMFYGGAKLHPTRLCTKESIGYAFSLDGRHFVKHRDNPIVPRDRVPDAAAFAEVHSYVEHPFIYLFHTLRYVSRGTDEHLGVQVLATQRPFTLRMPLLARDHLDTSGATALADCPPMSCEHIRRIGLSIECAYAPQATGGLKLEVKSSVDGVNYDTEDVAIFGVPCHPGETVRQTFRLDPVGMHMKLVVENTDSACEVRNLRLFATLGD